MVLRGECQNTRLTFGGTPHEKGTNEDNYGLWKHPTPCLKIGKTFACRALGSKQSLKTLWLRWSGPPAAGGTSLVTFLPYCIGFKWPFDWLTFVEWRHVLAPGRMSWCKRRISVAQKMDLFRRVLLASWWMFISLENCQDNLRQLNI